MHTVEQFQNHIDTMVTRLRADEQYEPNIDSFDRDLEKAGAMASDILGDRMDELEELAVSVFGDDPDIEMAEVFLRWLSVRVSLFAVGIGA